MSIMGLVRLRGRGAGQHVGARVMGLMLTALAIALIALGDAFLDRGTTVSISWLAFAEVFGGCLVICAVLFSRSLADKKSRVHLLVTRGSTTLNRGQRMRNAAQVFLMIAIFFGWWSWQATTLVAQYLDGEPEWISGTVVGIDDRVHLRPPCRLMLKIRSDAGGQLKVCHHTGLLVPVDPLSPGIPGQGQHLTVVVKSNWAGVVAERLEFNHHRISPGSS
jgi:hypothetical protein